MVNIIDIGSNSIRLFDGKQKTVITTRLAENMRGDMLDVNSIKRTAEGIKTLVSKANGHCHAFATEAVRKAANKDVFLSEVYRLTGLTVDVISGDTEALIGYMGANFGRKGSSTVIDLGGASCEIIFGSGDTIDFKRSFPFGCVTMTNTFNTNLNGIYSHVSNALNELPIYKTINHIAIGGTATSLAAMALKLDTYDQNTVDGYELSVTDIDELIPLILSGYNFPTLSDARRISIAQGGTVLKAVLNKLNITAVTVSEKDNLEGYQLYRNM